MQDGQVGQHGVIGNVGDVPDHCVEEGAKLQVKASVYHLIYILTLTFVHELWVVTEGTRS